MGKVNNALKMLAILRSRKKVTRAELASELEVCIREITRYKEALEYAGVNIKQTTGKYGGYELESKDYLLSLDVSESELMALDNVVEDLKVQGVHFYDDISNIRDKIKACKKIDIDNMKNYYSIGTRIRTDYEEERSKWLIINDAIINCYKLKIVYKSSNREVSERIVNPHFLYSYYGASYLLAYCEMRKDFRQFKLMRIDSIFIIKEKFEKQLIDIKEYFNNALGIFVGDNIDIELFIRHSYAQGFKEVQWFENEKINEVEDGIIYKAKVQKGKQLINWILQMGSNCIVIKPESLKNEIEEECKKILANYI